MFEKVLNTPPHSAKLHREDVLRTFPKVVLLAFPCGPLCNTKGCPLPTS